MTRKKTVRTLTLMILPLLILLGCNCGAVKQEARAVAGDVVDCTTANARTLTEQFAPLVDSLLRHATGVDGKIDWAPVKDATKQFALDAGGCVVANVVARHLAPRLADPTAPQVAGLELDQAALAAGFRELYPGKKFLTPSGEL